MNTYPAKLDRLRIASPCPISWDQMEGDDRVRFCGHCELNSIKIEAMGFKKHKVTNVLVEKNKLTCIDVILEFAGETVTIGIVGEPSLIDSPPGTIIIKGDLLRRLPLD